VFIPRERLMLDLGAGGVKSTTINLAFAEFVKDYRDLFARNENNVFEGSDLPTGGLLFQ
jgi:hypothetical protein